MFVARERVLNLGLLFHRSLCDKAGLQAGFEICRILIRLEVDARYDVLRQMVAQEEIFHVDALKRLDHLFLYHLDKARALFHPLLEFDAYLETLIHVLKILLLHDELASEKLEQALVIERLHDVLGVYIGRIEFERVVAPVSKRHKWQAPRLPFFTFELGNERPAGMRGERFLNSIERDDLSRIVLVETDERDSGCRGRYEIRSVRFDIPHERIVLKQIGH